VCGPRDSLHEGSLCAAVLSSCAARQVEILKYRVGSTELQAKQIKLAAAKEKLHRVNSDIGDAMSELEGRSCSIAWDGAAAFVATMVCTRSDVNAWCLPSTVSGTAVA
jgi:hypothetical protein